VLQEVIYLVVRGIDAKAEADTLRAWAVLMPIAVKTCDGTSEPVVQAEPLEAQMPT
jgi:hypothetical protein